MALFRATRRASRCRIELMDHELRLGYQELLRDLGWFPSDLHCEEKRRLAEQYLDATIAWFDVNRDLRAKFLERLRQPARNWLNYRGTGPRPASEQARLKAARAKLALAAHIAAHNC
jgi:hypothetical protein